MMKKRCIKISKCLLASCIARNMPTRTQLATVGHKISKWKKDQAHIYPIGIEKACEAVKHIRDPSKINNATAADDS